MTSHPVAAIVLAAGMGTRMRSALPKVMHPIAGKPMLGHVLAAAEQAGVGRRIVVVGPDMPSVAKLAAPAPAVQQTDRLGTAHAVSMAREELADFRQGTVLVLFGDTPLIRAETLAAMVAAREAGATIVVLGFEAADPTGYGRLIREASGRLARIVEHKDASEGERTVTLCNAGVMAFDAARLWDIVARIGNANAKGEYYLTDAVDLAVSDGAQCAIVTASEEEVMGVNTRLELSKAETIWQRRRRERAMLEGATLTDPASVFFAADTVLGQDVSIGPNVVFGPGVTIEDDVEIRAFCHIEGALVRSGAQIGPFARLRPGTDIAGGVRIGNFVEVKNAHFGPGAKANHLAYIGDADVGAGANIGAGVITCNYDGYLKHRTEIGADAFIGSNSALVAPVTVGAGAIVAAGSAIGGEIPADALALTRAERIVKPGKAKTMRALKVAEKAARKAAKE